MICVALQGQEAARVGLLGHRDEGGHVSGIWVQDILLGLLLGPILLQVDHDQEACGPVAGGDGLTMGLHNPHYIHTPLYDQVGVPVSASQEADHADEENGVDLDFEGSLEGLGSQEALQVPGVEEVPVGPEWVEVVPVDHGLVEDLWGLHWVGVLFDLDSFEGPLDLDLGVLLDLDLEEVL